ncbi:MAG: branched-chain amino acid ABC transporter permease, partial [Deltaproteobacteria bacterium]|nr:branched-chain amino acid ABC transporter permease [Deltaproteobacteria bacterium]
YFCLALFLLLVVLIVVVRLENSRIGRAWFAIREDEIAARCCGISLIRYKVMAFAASAAIGAMAGTFYAKWFRFIHPDMFKFWESILILCLIVFGGMGSIAGTMLGTLILIPLTEVLRTALPQSMFNARYLIYGLLLVIMMRLRPEGLIPFQLSRSRKAEQAKARMLGSEE